MKSDDLRRALCALFTSEDLQMPGWVNYSGLDVLKHQTGGIYLIGLNPALDDSNIPLSNYIPEQSASWNAFTDVCWKKHRTGVCEHIELGSHQIQVVALAKTLGVAVNHIFATNAIFVATRGSDELGALGVPRLWSQCWKVHQRFLAEMQPQMIIGLGNGEMSAFALLKSAASSWTEIPNPNREPKRQWKAGHATLPLFDEEALSVRIVGLPHPSKSRIFGSLVENFKAYEATIMDRV